MRHPPGISRDIRRTAVRDAAFVIQTLVQMPVHRHQQIMMTRADDVIAERHQHRWRQDAQRHETSPSRKPCVPKIIPISQGLSRASDVSLRPAISLNKNMQSRFPIDSARRMWFCAPSSRNAALPGSASCSLRPDLNNALSSSRVTAASIDRCKLAFNWLLS